MALLAVAAIRYGAIDARWRPHDGAAAVAAAAAAVAATAARGENLAASAAGLLSLRRASRRWKRSADKIESQGKRH